MRRRIVGLSVLAAVLAITLFGVPLAYGASQYLLDEERNEVERVAATAAISVADDLLGRELPADLTVTHGDIVLAAYGPDGARLVGHGPQRADAVVRRTDGGRIASADDVGGHLVVAVPVTEGNRVIGVIRAASDYSAVRSRIVTVWALMLGVAAAAVAVTWLLARRQGRRLARPLEGLAETAARLGEGDFSVRTAPSGIGEIDAVGTAVNRTAQRIGALVERERAFSADASHQLRTPVTGLRLGLETALELPAERQHTAIRAAIDAADRLEQTIEDLLELARDAEPRGTVLPVSQLVGEWSAEWVPWLSARGRRLDVRVDEALPQSRASTAAVRNVIAVLLDNAGTHGAGTVTLSVRDAGAALAIDVADEGAGPDDVEALFRRRAAGAKGHGIGLALARSLAEAEGGRLTLARARPPVFTLLLPVEPEGPDGPSG